MLKIENLNLSFKKQTLYKNASLVLQGPGLYALVAPNGMGKSVFFKSLMGSIKTDVLISLDGKSHEESKRLLSYVDAENNLFTSLTLWNNLRLFSSDLAKIEQYLELFHLQNRKNIKCKYLSAGERQRAAIILCILEEQPVILLDEPISHLDENTSKLILDNLKILSLNKYIIYSTHKLTHYGNPDAVITIKDYGFEKLKEEDFVEEKEASYEKTKINMKILSKIVFWAPNLLVTILIGILCSVVFLTSLFRGMTKEDIYIKTLQESSHDPYLIDTYFSNVPFEKRELPISDIYQYEKDINQGNPVILCTDFLTPYDWNYQRVKETQFWEAFLTDSFFNAFFLTNQFNEYSLDENEIIISDYVYSTLEEFNLIEKKGSDEVIYLFNHPLKIKYVFETQFDYWSSTYDEMLDKYTYAYEEMEEYLNEYNYIYHRCYLNEATFQSLKRDYYLANQDLSFYYNNQNFASDVYQEEELLVGRKPEAFNEIVVSDSFYKLLCGLDTLFHEEELRFTSLGVKNDYYRRFNWSAKIVGILKEDQGLEVMFQSFEGFSSFLDTGIRQEITWSYDRNNLKRADIVGFDKKGLLLASEYDYAIYKIYQKYDEINQILTTIFGITFALSILFYLLSTGIFYTLKRKNFKVLHWKKKTKHAVNRMVLLSTLLNIGIVCIIFLLLVFILNIKIFNPYLQASFQITFPLLEIQAGVVIGAVLMIGILIFLKYAFTFKK